MTTPDPEPGSQPARAQPSQPAQPSPGSGDRTEWHVALLGGVRRGGRWTMPARTVCITLVGGVSLDLREVTFSGPELTLVLVNIAGGVDLTVPAFVDVVVGGFRLIGRRRIAPPGVPPTVTLRVHTYGAVGGVHVRRV